MSVKNNGLVIYLRKLSILLIMSILFVSFTYEKRQTILPLNCVSAIVIDQESGRILYSKNSSSVLAMASTTKIITAIVAIEKGNLTDTVVVSSRAASVNGSTAGLKTGEKISLEELLYGLMLRSGNDAAIAIAEHIGGSVREFIRLMNEKALELGAYHTSFATPHGLDAEDHYTTAYDLARITAYAMKNEFFARLVSTKSISSGISGEFNRSYSNINKFLYRIDNSDGVKTGYTGNAGKCLVASVKHSYGRYICVVLNSGDRWRDAEKLVQYADKNYSFIKIMDSDDIIKKFRVYGGNHRYITGKVKNDLYLPVLSSEVSSYKMEVYAPSVLFSPIMENETIGNIVVNINDEIVAKYPVYSDREVKRKNFMDVLRSIIIK
jgi:D-alanyl-D-alanine carboxypeptidase (penicillin-binding protein 5/6)